MEDAARCGLSSTVTYENHAANGSALLEDICCKAEVVFQIDTSDRVFTNLYTQRFLKQTSLH